jgi:hypothetical protein
MKGHRLFIVILPLVVAFSVSCPKQDKVINEKNEEPVKVEESAKETDQIEADAINDALIPWPLHYVITKFSLLTVLGPRTVTSSDVKSCSEEVQKVVVDWLGKTSYTSLGELGNNESSPEGYLVIFHCGNGEKGQYYFNYEFDDSKLTPQYAIAFYYRDENGNDFNVPQLREGTSSCQNEVLNDWKRVSPSIIKAAECYKNGK